MVLVDFLKTVSKPFIQILEGGYWLFKADEEWSIKTVLSGIAVMSAIWGFSFVAGFPVILFAWIKHGQISAFGSIPFVCLGLGLLRCVFLAMQKRPAPKERYHFNLFSVCFILLPYGVWRVLRSGFRKLSSK